jgi:dolichyl-phosphate-mannose--protein O-mannosyl transferase
MGHNYTHAASASKCGGCTILSFRHGESRAGRKALLATVLFIIVVSAALRLYNLASPAEYMFDEIYYAKDAKAILDGRMDPKRDYPWEPGDVVSWAHPDAGKMAIAAGIALFGDRPVGWRLPGVVAGLALLACVYPIARRLGLSPGWALVALVLAAADLLGIAQSRIATLDVFVAAWTLLCILLALRFIQDGRRARWLVLCGLAGGLAVATKWSGVLALLAAGALIVLGDRVAELRSTPGDEQATAAPDEDHGGAARAARTAVSLVLALVVLPAAVYLATYIPYFADGHTLAHLRELHSQMWHFNTTLSAPHSYASAAPTWIVDYRPVWYSFVDKGEYRGVVAMGNPFLWWTGALALVAAPVLALWRRATLPLLPAGLVVVLYLPWFATARTSFLYYMTPAAPFLAILVAAVAAVLVGAAAATTPRVLVILAAVAAAVTALAWDYIGRAAAFVFWEAPGRVSDAVALAAASVGVAVALAVVIAALARSRTRTVLTAVLLGCIVGICVPFLPIVINLGIPADQFYRLIWFPSWI